MEPYKNRWNLRLFNKEYHCNEIKKREKIENFQSLLGVFLRRRFDWNSIVVYESNWKRHVNSSEKQTGRIWNGLRVNKADSLKNDCHHQWSEWLLTDLVYEKTFYVELRIGSIMYGVLYSIALFNAILVSLHVCPSTSRSSYMNTTFGDVVFSSFLHWLVCLSSSIVENVSLSLPSPSHLFAVCCVWCTVHWNIALTVLWIFVFILQAHTITLSDIVGGSHTYVYLSHACSFLFANFGIKEESEWEVLFYCQCIIHFRELFFEESSFLRMFIIFVSVLAE